MKTFNVNSWQESFSSELQTQAITALEDGQLLFFPNLAFPLMENEKRFLSPRFVDPKSKNISFNSATYELRGMAHITTSEQEQLRILLKRFAGQAHGLIKALFPHYVAPLIRARTSFRPVEVEGRETSYRKDDRRLHVDAFPANPNQGWRILRVFSNINPHGEDRVWRIGEPFEKVAEQFIPKIRKPFPGSSRVLQWLGITKSYRTLYDHFMLQMHDRMKGDEVYQKQAEQVELRLPPGSTWIVQTDQVSHAALSGQYMLEQTFYLPVQAMQDQNKSPLRILEKILGYALV